MHNKIIKMGIAFCVVLGLAMVCNSGVYASLIQEVQPDETAEVTGVVTSEDNQETPDVESNMSTATIASYTPSQHYRIVTVGDLPEDHDPSLVLKKGRTFTVVLNYSIKGEISSEGSDLFILKEDIYDSSGKILLMPKRTRIHCLYKVDEEQGKMKINITAFSMHLDLLRDISVLFSDPPRCTTNGERMKKALDITPLSSADEKKLVEENLRLRQQLFISPVMSAELILGIESEDRTSMRGRVIFGENASGDRTIDIGAGYQINLQVEKDILFSGPFVHRKRVRINQI